MHIKHVWEKEKWDTKDDLYYTQETSLQQPKLGQTKNGVWDESRLSWDSAKTSQDNTPNCVVGLHLFKSYNEVRVELRG